MWYIESTAIMKLPKLSNFNELYTPPEGFAYIKNLLPKEWVYWEMCYGKWHLANAMRLEWFNVIGDSTWDCFHSNPGNWKDYDYIITNPPYKNNKDFIKRAIELWKHFALLIRLEHMWGVEAFNIFKDLDIQLVIPKKRINFITPKTYWQTKWKSSASFHTIWLTWWFNLKKQITYVYLPDNYEWPSEKDFNYEYEGEDIK